MEVQGKRVAEHFPAYGDSAPSNRRVFGGTMPRAQDHAGHLPHSPRATRRSDPPRGSDRLTARPPGRSSPLRPARSLRSYRNDRSGQAGRRDHEIIQVHGAPPSDSGSAPLMGVPGTWPRKPTHHVYQLFLLTDSGTPWMTKRLGRTRGSPLRNRYRRGHPRGDHLPSSTVRAGSMKEPCDTSRHGKDGTSSTQAGRAGDKIVWLGAASTDAPVAAVHKRPSSATSPSGAPMPTHSPQIAHHRRDPVRNAGHAPAPIKPILRTCGPLRESWTEGGSEVPIHLMSCHSIPGMARFARRGSRFRR